MTNALPSRVALGERIFDLATGELSTIDSDSPPRRLQPQPAKLLALLVAKNGELLGRDEIKQAIWPEVEVDFDQSLSYCVRQVRTALDDSADAPRFVETLPRRGYRLLVTPRPLPAEPARKIPATPPSPPPLDRRRLAARATVLGAGLLAGVALWLALGARPGVPPSVGTAAPRLAIMPFDPPTGPTQVGDTSRIAHELLAGLGALGVERLAVLGPATTGAYPSDLRAVDRLIGEHDLDYVINGRFLPGDPTGDQEPSLLVELIRADGAHVWVERYPAGSDWSAAAREIERAIRAELGLPVGG